MLTKSGSVRLSEGTKIAFNLMEDDVSQNRVSDVSKFWNMMFTNTLKRIKNICYVAKKSR